MGSNSRVIYTYKPSLSSWSRGPVVVSTDEIELGGGCWKLSDVRDAQLASIEIPSRRLPADFTDPDFIRPSLGTYILGVALLIVGVVLLVVAQSGLGLLFFVSAWGTLLYSFLKHPVRWRVLTIELLLADDQWHSTNQVYWYADEKWHATRSLDAIKQAISAYNEGKSGDT